VFPARQLPFSEEQIDELALAGTIGIDELRKIAVRSERRGRGERWPHQDVQVGAQLVKGLAELARSGPPGTLRNLEPGHEPDAFGADLPVRGTLDGQFHFTRPQRHETERSGSEKTYSRHVRSPEDAEPGSKLLMFTYFHTVTINGAATF